MSKTLKRGVDPFLSLYKMHTAIFMLLLVVVAPNLLQYGPAGGAFCSPPTANNGLLGTSRSCFEDYGSMIQSNEDLHLIVLVHGLMGSPLEMRSLNERLKVQHFSKTQRNKKEHVWIHSATCNKGLTFDGIEAGGSRLADEINDLLLEIWTNILSRKVHLSLVGNSLGGLYGRYSLSKIQWDPSSMIHNNHKNTTEKRLVPNLFVTTATPHLGCAFQQTYLPLPRIVEFAIAYFMKQTGKDLFRFNNVIDKMTFKQNFTKPLKAFQKRIAYVNVHGTDFQVPTPTAAFWAQTDSLHHIVDDVPYSTCKEDEDPENNLKSQHIVMTLSTPSEVHDGIVSPQHLEDDNAVFNVPTSLLSLKLDELGWTKVLVDVRDEISLKINEEKDDKYSIKRKAKSVWTSRELLQEFDTGRLKSFPLGHTIMVANAKDDFNRKLNKGGLPIMDHLAKEIIDSTHQI